MCIEASKLENLIDFHILKEEASLQRQILNPLGEVHVAIEVCVCLLIVGVVM
jgi:hypothetical protein